MPSYNFEHKVTTSSPSAKNKWFLTLLKNRNFLYSINKNMQVKKVQTYTRKYFRDEPEWPPKTC